jgi:formylmethanofuran dehydrogenase subunit E-like metal-binding protein
MNIKERTFVLALLLAIMPGVALAESTIMEELGSKAAKAAMDQLKFEKGDENILTLTNAGYAVVDGQTTQAALKGLTAETGCSIGDGNLFQVLRPYWKPVWFFVFNKTSGEAIYMEADGSALKTSLDEFKAKPVDKVFSKISKANIDMDYLENHTDEGNVTFNQKAFNGNEFSLVSIANVWARGGSFDFIQDTCFHDHLCPGVTSGLFLPSM